MTLELVPMTRQEARAFIAAHHRHTRPPVGDIIRVGLTRDGDLVGVATAGRPTARALDDGRTLEITRVCTDGTTNACSRLYGAIARAAAALGYQRLITYTLAREPGASPRAAGFTEDAQLPARGNGGGRSRYDENLLGEPQRPPEAKIRWRRAIRL